MASVLPPKIILLRRESPEWHEWLEGKDLDGFPRVTGMTAAIISGKHPWKTAHGLWRDQIKRVPVEDESCNGSAEARHAHIERFGNTLSPPLCVEHPTIPWCGACLDGISLLGDETLLVKRQSGAWHAQAKAGVIPEHHWVELQWQLFCSSTASRGHYWSYDPHSGDGARVTVSPNPQFYAWMFVQARKFRESVASGESPPGDAWRATAERWLELKTLLDENEEAIERIRHELVKLMPENLDRVDKSGITVTRIRKQDSIDYSALLEGIGATMGDAVRHFVASRGLDVDETEARFRKAHDCPYRIVRSK